MPKSYANSPYAFGKADYLNLLKTWKRSQHKHAKNIAIIGAGMAGLTAAWLLSRAGHHIQLFEANNVVGGRVKTLREQFTSDFYAEAGAMRIPETHKLTMWLVKELFGLETFMFINQCSDAHIYVNNKRSTFGDYRAAPSALGFTLERHEQGYTAEQLFMQCIESFMCRNFRDLPEKNKSRLYALFDDTSSQARNAAGEIMAKFDQFSLLQFLKNEAFLDANKTQQLSQGATDLIGTLLSLEMHLPCSMAAILNDFLELHDQIRLFQIKGGMDNLPKSFVRSGGTIGRYKDGPRPDLARVIMYNTRVTEISAKAHKLQVEYENVITRCEGRRDFDLVVLAIPFSALRHVRMKNLTGPRKRRAIRQLHYDNSCKVLLEFGQRFWEDDLPEHKPIKGGCSITDLPIRQIYYPIPQQNNDASGRGVLLASYTWGDDSLRWTSLSSDDRIRFALRDLERVHHNLALESDCIGGVSHSWAEQEFTSGAFAMFEPYQKTTLFDDIWRPEALVHYCGGHTSTKHGWIEGAVESGIRVANEICSRIDRDPRLELRAWERE